MPQLPDQPDHDQPRLSEADARLLDQLLGEGQTDASAAQDGQGPAGDLLALLGRWEAAEAPTGLAQRTLSGVITSQPVSLSDEDAIALDALLALRRQGLSDGPMPADTRQRAERVSGLLSVLDRAAGEPVPEGLASRALQAIDQDRSDQRRLSVVSAASGGRWRPAGGGIRQIATTAALLMMVLSVLLPVLDKGRRDAMIAQCEQNLAGLGVDLQLLANDNKQLVRPDGAAPANFSHLSEFASKKVDGTRVPAHSVNLFILLDERGPTDAEHRICPAAERGSATAFYNGQNPVAGGPLRVFLTPRPIFADTNPLYRLTSTGLVRDAAIPGMTQSNNHDGAGQNVLISDGSVKWKVRPAVYRAGLNQEDNIWLLQRPEPGDKEPDVFLTP